MRTKRNRRQTLKTIGILLLLLICIMPINFGLALDSQKSNTEDADFKIEAAPKEEVVYGNLTSNGKVTNVYVVNAFTLSKDTKIKDKGDYFKVENLTNTEPLELDKKGNVTVEGEKGRFYYQGEMESKDIPWIINIKYYLDGKECKPDDLSGASGKGKILITTSKNPNVDSIYYDNYMLQTSVTIDSEKCTGLKTNGTVANSGTDKMITFASMPGEDSKMEIEGTFRDFSMGGISIAGIPFSMNQEAFNFSELDELVTGLNSLAAGVSTVNQGAAGLNAGLAEFSAGTGKLQEGVSQLGNSFAGLANGADEIATGATNLQAGSTQFKAGLDQLATQGNDLTTGSAEFNAALTQIAANPALGADPVLQATIQQLAAQYNAFNEGLIAYAGGVSGLSANYDGINSGIGGLAGGATELSNGITAAGAGAGTLVESVNSVANGASVLSSNMNTFANGVSQLNEETSAIPARVQGSIDSMLGKYNKEDFKPISFASKDNGEIGAVQFVFMTDEIKPKEVEKTEPLPEKPKTILERFLDLFK